MPSLEPCLGCRACETACPSGVEYGALAELARDRLNNISPKGPRKLLLDGLTNPKKMRLQLLLGRLWPGTRVPAFVSKMISGESAEANLPRSQQGSHWGPLDEAALPAIKGEVALLEGCVMRVLFPRVHEATKRLLRRVGYHVSDMDLGCCGSLYAHSGYLSESEKLVEQFDSRAGDMTVIANSAGCGSHLKDNSRAKVFDISEFLMSEGMAKLLAQTAGMNRTVTYHDACHLSHGQKITSQPRQLIKSIPGIKFTELEEADRCCGSAGIYNIVQPKMARRILDRKWGHIEKTDAEILVMGNPGCHAWIQQAASEHGGRVAVLHTAELLESAFSGLPQEFAALGSKTESNQSA